MIKYWNWKIISNFSTHSKGKTSWNIKYDNRVPKVSVEKNYVPPGPLCIEQELLDVFCWPYSEAEMGTKHYKEAPLSVGFISEKEHRKKLDISLICPDYYN